MRTADDRTSVSKWVLILIEKHLKIVIVHAWLK